MANFLDKSKFPEANDILGAGNQEGVGDLAIYRAPGVFISKWEFSDDEIEEIIKTRCAYIGVKGVPTYFPVWLAGKSPFITPEQVEQEIEGDIAAVNARLLSADVLERVSRATTEMQAARINDLYKDALGGSADLFRGCEQLVNFIIQKRGQAGALELYQ
jgi:hypothetical protein